MSAYSRTARTLAAVETIASWTGAAGRGAKLGDLLAFGEEPDSMPPRVARAWRRLLLLPLKELTGATNALNLTPLAVSLLGALPKAQLRVFKERCLAPDPPSLDDLGHKMRVTRERVRQIQNSAEETVRTILQQPRLNILEWRAQALATAIGVAVPFNSPLLREKLGEFGCAGDSVDDTDRLLLWLAGPYRLMHGWLVRMGTVVPHECKRLIAFADSFGVIGSCERASEILAELGLHPEVHQAWIRDCRYVRVFEGVTIVARGSVTDKSVPLLAVLREPQTPERLAVLVGEDHSPMTIRNAIHNDPRFVRSAKNEFGLSAWNLDASPTKRRTRRVPPVPEPEQTNLDSL